MNKVKCCLTYQSNFSDSFLIALVQESAFATFSLLLTRVLYFNLSHVSTLLLIVNRCLMNPKLNLCDQSQQWNRKSSNRSER